MPTKQLNLRVPDIELQILERLLQKAEADENRCDWEFIRSLQDKWLAAATQCTGISAKREVELRLYES